MTKGTDMKTFQAISIPDARALIETNEVVLVDIRDMDSYRAGHIEGAHWLDHTNVDLFLENTARDLPVVVYCYHGISSQSAAQYLVEQGFAAVYSLSGGFEAWKASSG